MAMFAHFMGRAIDRADHPLDPGDFGRCYRLLHATWAESWHARISEMAVYSQEWAGLTRVWYELEMLYEKEREQDRAPKLYNAMKTAYER